MAHPPCTDPLCCFALSIASAAEKDPEKSAAKLITPTAERSIGRGLKWLAAGQHDDGGFGSGTFRGNTAVAPWAAWP